jgi:hypothetical protein
MERSDRAREFMIDEKFSSFAFEQCGLDTEEAKKLSDLLAQEIQQNLGLVIKNKLEQAIGKLNEMGHELKLIEEKADYIGYSAVLNTNPKCSYKLRIDFDSVVMTGYSHLNSLEEGGDFDLAD